ncbi:MAG TPA: hypothetical protein VGO40_07380 [Longimicrobium sp.]|jgi:hypothetical protein|nr:hypothetical protein [Longimicrobium sp.]
MHKLKLEVEELAVETFELDDAARAAAGTVRAHEVQAGQAVRTMPISSCFFSACATCGIYC